MVLSRHSIADLYASVDECLQAMEATKQRLEDLERVVEDDYKFLNRNVQTFWHGWKHERQVVQYLLKVPLGLVFPLGIL
jgi:O6-methylguanine-DNA--protein-cysteine methyltransferase